MSVSSRSCVGEDLSALTNISVSISNPDKGRTEMSLLMSVRYLRAGEHLYSYVTASQHDYCERR